MSTVLQVKGLTKSYGTRLLFDDATVSVVEGQKIGLIGANGSGKTTLLRMILGDEGADTGQVLIYPNARLGYLEQQEVFPPGETVGDYLVRTSGREPWECAKMASAFEVKNEKLESLFSGLSGGYQMRVRLAAILVREPNLLLLDEPTNYLDLQTILLLEKVLRSYRGALLVVSHDREFLKNVCTHTLELEHHKLTLFAGDIEAYFADKEIRLENIRRHNRKVSIQQRHLKDFVDRFRAGTKASQAQSKIKQIARLKTIEIKHTTRSVRINIPDVPQRNAPALECKDLTVGYASGSPVLQGIDFEINRGEHMAVVGENGQGKSTLLKTLANELAPLSGRFKWGHNLRIAYYAQHVPQMMPTQGTAGDYLSASADRVLPEELLRMAGNFLFTKDDLEKPIGVLSGGEKARLCLAAMCLGRYDVLLMDEPTNHLDFDTVEALGDALDEFRGTVVFVSHGRTFVSQLATSILEIRDGKAIRYPYPYEIYVHELRTHERFSQPDEDDGSVPESGMAYVRTKADVYQDVQKEKRAQERSEQAVRGLTGEKARLLAWYAANPTAVNIAKAKRLKEIDEEMLEGEAAWFEAQTKIDALNNELKTAKKAD
jgi:ATP-binding cassette subfamily F protein 3